jgi:hypothetical protein
MKNDLEYLKKTLYRINRVAAKTKRLDPNLFEAAYAINKAIIELENSLKGQTL